MKLEREEFDSLIEWTSKKLLQYHGGTTMEPFVNDMPVDVWVFSNPNGAIIYFKAINVESGDAVPDRVVQAIKYDDDGSQKLQELVQFLKDNVKEDDEVVSLAA